MPTAARIDERTHNYGAPAISAQLGSIHNIIIIRAAAVKAVHIVCVVCRVFNSQMLLRATQLNSGVMFSLRNWNNCGFNVYYNIAQTVEPNIEIVFTTIFMQTVSQSQQYRICLARQCPPEHTHTPLFHYILCGRGHGVRLHTHTGQRQAKTTLTQPPTFRLTHTP